MNKPPKIISCEVLRDEIESVNPGLTIDFVPGALHDYPDKLRAALQERIDATPGDCDILLCCGRCSNGTVGLCARGHHLVLPAVDDCIALLLGSRSHYLAEHRRCPGTYYYTRGWIDFIDDPYKDYLKIIPKYGEEKAARIARMILANYTRVAVIDTGVVPMEQFRDYVSTVAAFYDLPIAYLEGSLRYIEKLVSGPRDHEFLVVPPGGVLDESLFWHLDDQAVGSG
ncbi:MAG: DUF1638 domain-containing protein [Thermoleophilia bacterium]